MRIDCMKKFNAKLCKNEFYSIIISIGCIIFSVIVRMILTFDVDAFLVMIYIFGCLQILKTIKNNKWPGNILQFLGHYSVYIWLTHTFFFILLFSESVYAVEICNIDIYSNSMYLFIYRCWVG